VFEREYCYFVVGPQFLPVAGWVAVGEIFLTFNLAFSFLSDSEGTPILRDHQLNRQQDPGLISTLRPHYRVMVMDDEPQPMKAPVTRKSGVPEVVCPGCGHVNRFADFDAVIVFIYAGARSV
jgi:hypothetical protein